ncbi:MAG: prepilin-type N-terminal cleavage/methylation domain-containing protein [Gallionella sp.]|jgi:prepilin-type N-terminal cleavage/methylation domain-containing protein/prepilin-type processing-associated H-X9-DG protein
MQAFTLVELLVVIAIIAILAGIAIPVINNARKSSQRSTCAANLRQLGLAVLIYANDNKGLLPWAYKTNQGAWSDVSTPPLVQQLGLSGVDADRRRTMKSAFKCPSAESDPVAICDYTANANVMGYDVANTPYPVRRLNTFSRSVSTVLIAEKNVEGGMDANKWFDFVFWPAGNVLVDRHSSRGNMVFLDGHVASKSRAELTAGEITGVY